MSKQKKSSISKEEAVQVRAAASDFIQKMREDAKHRKEIISKASRVIHIETSDGTRESKHEREFFEHEKFGGGSFWRWEWFRPFYIDESSLDIVASEHHLIDHVCKEDSGRLPKHISVSLYDIVEQILHRHNEHTDNVKKKVKFEEVGYTTVKFWKLPKDWVFKTGTDAMTVGEFNDLHRSKFDEDE